MYHENHGDMDEAQAVRVAHLLERQHQHYHGSLSLKISEKSVRIVPLAARNGCSTRKTFRVVEELLKSIWPGHDGKVVI
jgi:hypothetical protein